MAALAIDLSRLQLGVNELQTAADAGALRAGAILMVDADANPATGAIVLEYTCTEWSIGTASIDQQF